MHKIASIINRSPLANKKRVFSGVQPSGDLHIGNYVGALTQWVAMQEEYQCIFCVVDYHAITVKQDPQILKKKIIEIAKLYLAAGIDPKMSIVFQQSSVTAHTELAWILNCLARMSDLNRMTQFKEKSGIQKIEKMPTERIIKKTPHSDGSKSREVMQKDDYINELYNKVGVGIFDYPILMAADILLYNTDAVPVGEDQSQHVELTRDIAKRFNQQFSQTFKIPDLIIRKEGARIMGLDDPKTKMSKSAKSEYNRIALTDDPDVAAKKIMKAVTDSGSEIIFDPVKKPAISNLLTIYSALSEKKVKDLERSYDGKGYGAFKKDLAETVKIFLTNFQEKYYGISDREVRKILDEGAAKARPIADATLKKVKENIGVN